ncbi:protein of unknown function [Methylorubrum extorquens DM4]|uniref:Uncharacterized protein n=1 Tax=Methylorubrum extorquens (strain DSM 6343 / CIP 106787 / DM4) TaxID=661410 RepID=C7C9B6_METED|nr:hypothetical protein [Methylorubrum extorquens]CAX22082.1 protein of unknown function [Methylorubrum extorquens DM4]
MFFRTPLKNQSHAGILACCILTPLDDEMHDLLNGHVAVPTKPEPTYLQLTAVEKARGWLQQAEQLLVDAKSNGGTTEKIAESQRLVERLRLRVRHAEAVEALGPLEYGRTLEFHCGDTDLYAIADKDTGFLFHVPWNMAPDDIRRTIAIYDGAFYAGLMQGRKEVRRPILSALGLLD